MGIIQILLLSTTCLSISYIAFRITFGNGTRFRQQRLFLVSSVVISLLLPFTGISLDIPDLSGKRSESTHEIQPVINESEQPPGIIQTPDSFYLNTYYIIKVYSIITLLFITITLIQFIRIVWLYIISKKTDHAKGEILCSGRIESSFSFFRWIFIPADITDEAERESIITHESIHISQYHSFDNVLIGLVTALMWFNPFAWMMKKSLHLIHEYLADEGTLDTGVDRLKYQTHLINHVTEERLICLTSNFNNSLIKKRMIMMTKSKDLGQNKFKILTLIPLSVILLLMVAIINGLFPAEATASVAENINTEQLSPKVSEEVTYQQQDTIKKKTLKIKTVENESKGGTNEIRVIGYGNKDTTVQKGVIVDLGESGSGEAGKLIYVVDGVKVDNIENIDAETIESINVMKEDNLIIIRTKKSAVQKSDSTNSGIKIKSIQDNVLYIIDGKPSDKSQLEKIDPEQIEKIDVIKGKESIKKYTDKEYDGVIIITTKGR